MNRAHKEITESVKASIEKMPIVFPSQYGKLYAEAAHLRNIILSPDKLLTVEMLDEKMVRHVISLCECADQAVEAIKNQNLSKLQEILDETTLLRDEIKELQKVVYQDALTKSYNRKWLYDTYLDTDEASLKVNGTIVVIDLNAFKSVNDLYGHVVGDKVLVHIALKLKETGGQVVRYGGDEFLLIFDAAALLSNIQEKVSTSLHYFEKKSFKINKQSFKVTFSYGIAAFSKGEKFNTIIDQADKAMYAHKTKK